MASPVNWGHPLNRGLLGWWMVLPGMLGGSRLDDLTNMGSSGHPAKLANMAPDDWVRGTRPGGWGALDLDGTDDRLETSGVKDIFGTAHMTAMCWVKQNTLRTLDAPFGQFNGSDEGWVMESGLTDTFVLLYVGENGNEYGQTGAILDTTTWHHWCMIYDGTQATDATKIRFLFDGVEQTLSFASPPKPTITGTFSELMIGDTASGGREMPAQLDDFRFYDRTLTNAEAVRVFELSKQGYPGILNRVARRVFLSGAAVGSLVYNRQARDQHNLIR